MVPDPDSGSVGGREARAGSDAADGCCAGVSHGMTDHDVELDVRLFSALANDTRYEALRLLAAADGEVCACDLEPALSVNQSSTSRALTALHQAGLVERRKEGRWRYYTTTPRAETLLTAVDTTREAAR
jgi:ArsR family transcriptional regulator